MNDNCKIFLDPIYVPPDDTKHELDIVAIHGLNPTGKRNHARDTWSGGKDRDVLWLKDFLPTRAPNARVLLFGYNSSVAIDSSIAGIAENAETLLQMLHLKRNDDQTKDLPIIFVCHSLGGLVTKKALVKAALDDKENNVTIRNSTFGIVFFATPHRGGKHADLGEVIGSVARFCLRTPKNTNLEALKKTLFADGLLEEFQHRQRHYHYVSFYETKSYRKFGPVIVSRESAILGAEKELAIAIDADHSEICRYDSRAGIYEQQVEPTIREFVKKALVAAKERRAQPKLKRKLREAEVNLMRDVIGMLDIPKRILQFTKRQEAMWKKYKDESTHYDILSWLSDVEYEEHYYFHVNQIVKGTCIWLLEHEKFKIWHESTGSEILWLRGDPGTGKTKLTSHVIRYCLEEKEKLESNQAIAYFYCDRNEPSRSMDSRLIFNTILKQLSIRDLDSPLHSTVVSEYEKRRKRNNKPRKFTVDESIGLVIELTDMYPQTTIIVDGVDEITGENGTRLNFIDGIQRIIKESQGLVKVFLSSRFEGDIAVRLRNVRNHYITPSDNTQDIELFVNSLVQKCISQERLLPEEPLSEELRKFISQNLCRSSHGMFLWAYFQLERLCDCIAEEEIRDLFSTTIPQPEQLKSVYDEIFKRVKAEKGWGGQLATGLMKLIIAAVRPLMVEEACALVCAEFNFNQPIPLERILAKCHNLVIEDKAQGVVRFFHLSVREYLEKEQGYTPKDVQNTVLRLCLQLIRRHCTKKTDIKNPKPLLEYALTYWMRHCLNAQRLGIDKNNDEELRHFFFGPYGLGDGFKFFHAQFGGLPLRWKDEILGRFYPSETSQSPGTFAIYVAALLGYRPFIFSCLTAGDLVDFKGWHSSDLQETPLTFAIESGHERLIELLLEKGHYERQKGKYDSILDAAATHGMLNLVLQLLGSRNSNNSNKPLLTEAITALPMIQETWMKEHTYPRGELSRVSKALVSAARRGHLQIVEALLSYGADINFTSNFDEDAFVGDFQTLSWGPGDGDNGSPLVAAAFNGKTDVINLLLRYGAIVKQQTSAGHALSAAACKGSLASMKALLLNGADPNQEDRVYGYPLFAAIYSKYIPDPLPVQLLIEYGASLTIKGTRDQSPIQAAVEQDSAEVLELLLEHGLEIGNSNEEGLLELAIGTRSWESLDWLLALSQGKEVNSRIPNGDTLLMEVLGNVWESDESVYAVNVLLKHNVDVNARGGELGCALSSCARDPLNVDSMRLLIANGADINAQCGEYGCPLSTVVIYGHPEMVGVLLENGADVNLPGGKYSCPLGAADALLMRGSSDAAWEDLIPKGEVIKRMLLAKGAKYV